MEKGENTFWEWDHTVGIRQNFVNWISFICTFEVAKLKLIKIVLDSNTHIINHQDNETFKKEHFILTKNGWNYFENWIVFIFLTDKFKTSFFRRWSNKAENIFEIDLSSTQVMAQNKNRKTA